MPKGVPKNGTKRKRTKVDKTQYSSHYVVKVGLSKLLNNHPNLIPVIQLNAMEITRVSMRLTRFLNIFVLRLLENDCIIPEFNQTMIQRIISVLFGKDSKDRTNNVTIINQMINMDNIVSKLRYKCHNISKLLNYVARTLKTNISNMLKFTLEQRLKKYLRARMSELLTDEQPPKSEQRRVIDYIIRKLTFTTPVFDFRKQPPMVLIQLIPILILEVCSLLDCNNETIIDESFVETNSNKMFVFYWYIQKFFIEKEIQSFNLMPLSHFKCRNIEIGTNDLHSLLQQSSGIGRKKKGQLAPEPIKLDYNIKCLNIGSKQIQIDSIRTDGIQASVVLRHRLVGNHVNNRSKQEKEEEEEPKKKRRKKKIVIISPVMVVKPSYLIGIDPGIVTIQSCVDSDGHKWELSNKKYRHQSHHSKNVKRALKYKNSWNKLNEKNVDNLNNMIKQSSVSTSNLFIEHIDSIIQVEQHLLQYYCQSKLKRLNWDSYIMGARAIDTFINDIKIRAKGREMMIGMGNGGFSNSYQGHSTTPKGKLLKKMLEKKLPIKMIDEYMTSQKCNGCQSHMKAVRHKRLDKNSVLTTSIVRGVKQCTTTVCLVTHNRDVNAAKNILELLRLELDGKDRPEALRRNCQTVTKNLNQIVDHILGCSSIMSLKLKI